MGGFIFKVLSSAKVCCCCHLPLPVQVVRGWGGFAAEQERVSHRQHHTFKGRLKLPRETRYQISYCDVLRTENSTCADTRESKTGSTWSRFCYILLPALLFGCRRVCTRASGEGSSGWEETQLAKINQGDFTFYPQRKWFKDPRKYGEVYKGQVYSSNKYQRSFIPPTYKLSI